MPRTDFNTGSATNTFLRIDYREIVHHLNREIRTVFLTQSAGDTAETAGLDNVWAPLMVGAEHFEIAGGFPQENDSLGAGLGAGTAAGTLVFIDDRYAIDQMDRVKLTGLHTVSHAAAGEGAELRSI
jgi:hypothetical protein